MTPSPQGDSLSRMATQRVLHDKRITAAGEFSDALTHEGLKHLVEQAGGTWLTELDDTATHLITTKTEWEKQSIIGMRC